MNTNNSIIAQAIVGSSNNMGDFKPTKQFYSATGIRQKRFGQIYRGEKSPEIKELQAISACLNIPIEKFVIPS